MAVTRPRAAGEPGGRARRGGAKRARGRGPRPVQESLVTAVARWGVAPGKDAPGQALVTTVFACWSAIAGPELADHVQPIRLTGDVLVVAADHPAWATKARAASQELLAQVANMAGEAPTRLDVVVRGRL